MNNKKISIVLLSVVLFISALYSGIDANAESGWKSNAVGWWYEYSDGSYPISKWVQVGGYWYYFTQSGYMDYSEYRDGYWLESDGSWNTLYYGGHWSKDNNGWWYSDSSGWYPVSQWLWIDGKCYYFKSSGYMACDEWIDGCYVDSTGAWIRGDNNSGEGGSIVHSYDTLATFDGITFMMANSVVNGKKYRDIRENNGDFRFSKDGYKKYQCRIYTTQEIKKTDIFVKVNGDEGYRNIGDYAQIFPDLNNPKSRSWSQSYKYGGEIQGFMLFDDYVEEQYSESRWKNMIDSGFVNYIEVRIECIDKGEQDIEIYYRGKKLFDDTFSTKCDDFVPDKYAMISYLKNTDTINSDILKYKNNMSDLELLSAGMYWISNHSYDDYTCLSCNTVARMLQKKGYITIPLACSKYDENGKLINDYSNFYMLSENNTGTSTWGHEKLYVFFPPDSLCLVECQGRSDLKSGETDFSQPWIYNELELISISKQLNDLRDYNNIKEMIKGETGYDITKYDPFDCLTWY